MCCVAWTDVLMSSVTLRVNESELSTLLRSIVSVIFPVATYVQQVRIVALDRTNRAGFPGDYTLRGWSHGHIIEAVPERVSGARGAVGGRAGIAERERLDELECENRQLECANEILRKASASSHRWSLTAARSDSGVHRRPPRGVRGRASAPSYRSPRRRTTRPRRASAVLMSSDGHPHTLRRLSFCFTRDGSGMVIQTWVLSKRFCMSRKR